MKNYAIKRYEPTDYAAWNAFIGSAENATFLFNRGFMEYHSDRFTDFSLMVFSNQKPVAVLPANVFGETVYSHQGLTYGGIVFGKTPRLEKVLAIFKEILEYLHNNQIVNLQIKLLPYFYSRVFSQETEYALFAADAKLIRRDSLSVVDLSEPLQFSKNRNEGINKGIKNKLEIMETDDLSGFWNQILIPNLHEKHQALPVHSLPEIELLKSRFPKNIRQFNVYHDGKIVAGTTIFETENVAHAQYISGNSDKNILGSLDFLHDHLLKNTFKEKKFFDFGISNENQGKNLNGGLLYWKETFGSRIIVQDFYEVETAGFARLETIVI
ncbi:MAG TPA: hypothetical protein VK528_14335 [Flavobacterium sp.]|nr:hypothetical protein [Flavobacterium sp.]